MIGRLKEETRNARLDQAPSVDGGSGGGRADRGELDRESALSRHAAVGRALFFTQDQLVHPGTNQLYIPYLENRRERNSVLFVQWNERPDAAIVLQETMGFRYQRQLTAYASWEVDQEAYEQLKEPQPITLTVHYRNGTIKQVRAGTLRKREESVLGIKGKGAGPTTVP